MGKVEIVMIPVSWSMQRESAWLAEQTGEMEKIKSGRLAESQESCNDVAELLDAGYTIIAQQLLESTGRTLIAFVMYKAAES